MSLIYYLGKCIHYAYITTIYYLFLILIMCIRVYTIFSVYSIYRLRIQIVLFKYNEFIDISDKLFLIIITIYPDFNSIQF